MKEKTKRKWFRKKEIVSENVVPVTGKRCSLLIKSESGTHWKQRKVIQLLPNSLTGKLINLYVEWNPS